MAQEKESRKGNRRPLPNSRKVLPHKDERTSSKTPTKTMDSYSKEGGYDVVTGEVFGPSSES